LTNIPNNFGVFNKRTHILSQTTLHKESFSNTNDAKKWFFTDLALSVHEDTCTKLEWQLFDNNKLIYTMAWGTKGDPNILPDDDWAGIYHRRKKELMDQKQWARNPYITEIVDSHLF
jgi:hypothetical protein